jgi:WhiB family redox-sensing transcriptional regulator
VRRPSQSALWFADTARDMRVAVLICRSCPVRTECLDWAVSTGQHEGVWGGMTPEERRRLRRRWA